MGGGIASGSTTSQSQAQLVRMHHHGSANSPTNSMHGIPGLRHRSRWCYLPAWCVRSPARSCKRLLTTLPVAIAAYCALAAEFLSRYAQERPIRLVPGEPYRGTMDVRLKRMLYAMSIMTVFIIIRYAARSSSFFRYLLLMVCRTIYRTVEFVGGWNGKVNSTQWFVGTYLCYESQHRIVTNYCAVVFDATMITLAMWTLNIFHPGIYLQKSDYPYPTNGITPDNGPEMKVV